MHGKWLIVLCLPLIGAACESSSIPSSPNGAPVDDRIRIPIGQSVRVTVGLNDAIGNIDPLADWPDYRFRVVYVMASEPGKAMLRVVSDEETDARPAAWRVLNTTCCSNWNWQSIHQLTVTIPAPTDLLVELSIPVSGPAETFTISTSRVDE